MLELLGFGAIFLFTVGMAAVFGGVGNLFGGGYARQPSSLSDARVQAYRDAMLNARLHATSASEEAPASPASN